MRRVGQLIIWLGAGLRYIGFFSTNQILKKCLSQRDLGQQVCLAHGNIFWLKYFDRFDIYIYIYIYIKILSRSLTFNADNYLTYTCISIKRGHKTNTQITGTTAVYPAGYH